MTSQADQDLTARPLAVPPTLAAELLPQVFGPTCQERPEAVGLIWGASIGPHSVVPYDAGVAAGAVLRALSLQVRPSACRTASAGREFSRGSGDEARGMNHARSRRTTTDDDVLKGWRKST